MPTKTNGRIDGDGWSRGDDAHSGRRNSASREKSNRRASFMISICWIGWFAPTNQRMTVLIELRNSYESSFKKLQ